MPQIVLGKRPANFKHTVKTPLLDGTEGVMDVLYKYRTLEEFGEFLDEWTKKVAAKIEAEAAAQDKAKRAAKKRGETYEPPALTNKQLRHEQAQANADYLLEILDGWGLDAEFTPAAVLQLCNEYPGMADQAISDYRRAISEGHLGN